MSEYISPGQNMVSDFLKDRPIMLAQDTFEHLVPQLTGELFELWESYTQSLDPDHPATKETVEMEMADVGIYLFALCNLLEIDIEEVVEKKIIINEKRFPSELFQEGSFIEIYLKRKRELGEID